MVLIVENDKDIGDSLCFLLKEWGIECEVVKTFREALERIKGSHFEKILVDIGIHMSNPDSFVSACKMLCEDSDIIVMGATSPKTLEAYAHNMGIKNYLSKPFDLNKMEQILLN